MRILSTKKLSSQDKDAISTQLTCEVDDYAFIQLQKIESAAMHQVINNWIAKPCIVFVTSPFAVQCLKEYCIHIGMPVHWSFICINGKTQDELSQWLGKSAIMVSAKEIKELIPVIESIKNQTVLFFAGNMSSDVIDTHINTIDNEYNKLIIYHNQPSPITIDGDYDYYLFFSPSGVRSYFTHNSNKDIKAIAIGNTTAAALQQQQVQHIQIASQPSITAMISLIL